MNFVSKETDIERAAAILGLNQPTAADVIKRESFASDAEYAVALARMKMVMATPEYQEAVRKTMRENQARKEAELHEKEEKLRKQFRKKAWLSDHETREIEKKASEQAEIDLGKGKIRASEIGATIRRYTEEFSNMAKDQKAENQMMNIIFRGKVESTPLDEDYDS